MEEWLIQNVLGLVSSSLIIHISKIIIGSEARRYKNVRMRKKKFKLMDVKMKKIMR